MAPIPSETKPEGAATAEPFAAVAMRWTLVATIVVLPVTVAPFTYDVFNVPKLGVLICSVSIALALYLFQKINGTAPPIPRAAWVVPGALLVPLIASWMFSPYRGWALFGQYSRFQGLLPYAAFCLLGILLVAGFRGRLRQLAWALAGSGGLVALGLLAGMAGLTAAGIANQAGTLGNSNYVGGFLAITLPLSLHLWLNEPGRSYGSMATTALTATGLILSFSQGGQLAAVAGVAVVLGHHTGRRRGRRLSLLVASLVAMSAVGVVAVNLVTPLGGFTAMTRSNMWSTALAMGLDSPVVGSGPNSFAIEGPRYRSLEDSLTLGGQVAGYAPIGIEYQTSDDPHSVPLSFFANAGALGLAGLLFGWAWALRRGSAVARNDAMGAAFFAALVAYMVQALISVDEVTLRLGFWVAVAGVVSPAAGPVTVEAVTPKASRIRNWVAGGVAVVVTGVGIVYAVAFVLADRDARQGNHLFAEGRVREGASALGSAIAMRNETLYREVLAGRLGIAASETGAGGAPLIERMREVNAYLDELPDVGALHAYARLMSYWSHHDESARPVALDLYHRVAELDPVNPLITVETAEVLVDLGRTEEALSMLEALRDDLTGRVPEYWGALSMTRLAAGDLGGAATALAEATRIDPTDCRVRLADTLVTLHGADPSAEPANDALRLILSCDPGLYDMFLRRLPSRYMDRYS